MAFVSLQLLLYNARHGHSNVTRTSVTLTADVLRQFLMITPKQNIAKFRTGYTRECQTYLIKLDLVLRRPRMNKFFVTTSSQSDLVFIKIISYRSP